MGIVIPLEWEYNYQDMVKFKTRVTKLTHTDPETQVIDERIESVIIEPYKTEPFFLTYSKQICSLCGMSIFNATIKVLWKILEFTEWDTGVASITVNKREEIMKACNISNTSYYRAVDDLVKAGIIYKDRGSYMINPDMFWKGNAKSRKSLIEAKAKLALIPEYKEGT